MKNRDLRKKFQIGVITFGVLFFMLLGALTYLSGHIDGLLYTTVTTSLSASGDLDNPDEVFPAYTLVPASSIKGNELYYVKRNSKGDYEVATMEVNIIKSDGMQTEISKLDINVLAICDSNKDYEIGETVLVKADIL